MSLSSKAASARPTRRWAFDCASFPRAGDVVSNVVTRRQREAKEPRMEPHGYLHGDFRNEDKGPNQKEDSEKIFYEAAMAVGTNAGKSLFFTAFALYMSGNTLHIFSIFALGMAIWTPVNGLLSISNAFAKFEDSPVNTLLPKLVYIASNIGGILLVLYKFNSLGLLPNSPLDLISTLPPPIPTDYSVGSFLTGS